jgi:hypothetical protein
MRREPNDRGPEIAPAENLYRIVTVRNGWIDADGGISSAAFNQDWFSVEIESRTGGPEDSITRVPGGCAVIRFNCGCARSVGYDARDERDEQYPDNLAHAHVYLDVGNSQRKKSARRLLEVCTPSVIFNVCADAGLAG